MRPNIASILITLTFGIGCASQSDNTAQIEGVLRLITHPCVNPSVDTAPVFGQVPPTDGLLTFLERELNNTIKEAASASEELKNWSALFDSKTYARWLLNVSTLQIPKTQRNNLSEIENSRLNVYLQLANYAYFLLKQETADYTINIKGSQVLANLRVQILKVMCKLQELLQRNEEELRVFATQDIAGHLFQLETMKMSSGSKRAVCAIAVDLMSATIKKIVVV